MLEMKITIAAPDLAAAINNLAVSLGNEGTAENPALRIAAITAQRFIKASDVNGFVEYLKNTEGLTDEQIHAVCGDYVKGNSDFFNPTQQAPGAPLSATPAQTATPIAPTAPAVAPAPAVTPAANVPVAPVAQAPVMPQQPVAPAVPTGAPTYTLEMIARAGTALVDAGKMDALCGLLAKYGVEALTALDPAQYGNFANDLRALGAQI